MIGSAICFKSCVLQIAADNSVFKPLLEKGKDPKRREFLLLYSVRISTVFETRANLRLRVCQAYKLECPSHTFCSNSSQKDTTLKTQSHIHGTAIFIFLSLNNINLHWTVRLTALLFPSPSLLVAWQEYIPEKEISKVKIISNEPNVNWKLLQNSALRLFSKTMEL